MALEDVAIWYALVVGIAMSAGIFISDDSEDGKPVQYRGLWDGISKTTCRWSQAVSRDGGKTWSDLWLMQWTRV